MSYSDLIEVRDIPILGETNWVWPKNDKGAFGSETDGPMRDWIDSHSTEFFKYVRKFDVVVTAGACCGMYARFYAKKFKYVYAFEPDPLSFHCLVQNTPYDHVIKFNTGLSNACGIAGLLRNSEQNVGMNTVAEKPNGFHISMLTVDTLGLNACDLLQLDVEGMELHAILGAANTIRAFRPVIICEKFSTDDAKQVMGDGFGYEYMGNSFADAIYVPKEWQ